ncbi:DNA helicase [Proteiniborus sp. MB09-C3]|uniref:DNA helicase n=1 Tax=Proteiniborus sp. MB09-C3 TaxID=3050072 RepID=UPI00255543F3|nr:DNA helicase [Proteiniborus sp. MB09-C3]WIV11372.1 DNA helicase [Proteiniborus sp. MB09-C3]
MINEIKTIVQNYLNNAKLTSLMVGTVAADGIKISAKLTIPNELIVGNLKRTIQLGNKVRLLRNHGGQQFYILEVVVE